MTLATRYPVKPILGAVDLQPHSRQVVQRALSLAGEQGRPLLVLHVVHETERTAGFYRRHGNGDHVLPMKEIAEKLLRQLVDDVVSEHAGEIGFPGIEMQVVGGIPAGRIVEVAERVDADTIVMMNDEHSGLDRFWCCSVAEDVLKQTNRNMVLLHPDIEHALPIGLNPAGVSQTHAA